MTASCDHESLDDAPVPYELTRAGWAASRAADVPRTLTAAEAAAWFGLSIEHIRWLAKHERIVAIKVDRSWLVDGPSVEAWRTRRRVARSSGRREPWVPAAPLLRQIELAGGDYAVGVRLHTADKRALERARETGWMTLWAADELAVRLLGLPATMLWSEAELGG